MDQQRTIGAERTSNWEQTADLKKMIIEKAPFYCSGRKKLKEAWKMSTDVVPAVHVDYVNRKDYLKIGEQKFSVRKTRPMTTEVTPLQEYPARTLIEVYKPALREPKIPFEEIKTAVMRAGSKNEIKDMIIDLVVHILSPMANCTEKQIAENLANGIALAKREDAPILIEEIYDEDRIVKITVHRIKRQKDLTRIPEKSGLEMENVGPNGSVKRRNCDTETATSEQQVARNRWSEAGIWPKQFLH